MRGHPYYEFDIGSGLTDMKLKVNGRYVLDAVTGSPTTYDMTEVAMQQNPQAQAIRTAVRLATMSFRLFERPVSKRRRRK